MTIVVEKNWGTKGCFPCNRVVCVSAAADGVGEVRGRVNEEGSSGCVLLCSGLKVEWVRTGRSFPHREYRI